jgi:Ca2+-binding RTX toxin-like protein
VTADTAGLTLTCSATSGGGTTTVSTVVKRDTVAPTVACGTPAPTFTPNQVGAVTATYTDGLSGPPSGSMNILANTNTVGNFTATLAAVDRAGNRTAKACPYSVGIPACNGKTPTIVGTGLNNVITGTAGNDVIQGLGGNDTIDGRGGNDTICGGDHVDKVLGGDGADWIDGGAHNDDLNGGNGDDFLDGGLGSDSLRGDGGRDTCISGEVRTSSCEP